MPDQTRMMTYAEAAQLLGIKVESVMRRARNRKWHKELGNDGLARIAVPLRSFRRMIPLPFLLMIRRSLRRTIRAYPLG